MLMIILDIHKYLMKKHDIKWYLQLFKSSSFGGSLAGDNPTAKVSDHIKRISLKNQPCRAGSMLIDINPNEPFNYPFLSELISVMEVVILFIIHILEYVFEIK